jgi:hypothetical protein
VEAANECLLVMAEEELEEERQARHVVEGERELAEAEVTQKQEALARMSMNNWYVESKTLKAKSNELQLESQTLQEKLRKAERDLDKHHLPTPLSTPVSSPPTSPRALRKKFEAAAAAALATAVAFQAVEFANNEALG